MRKRLALILAIIMLACVFLACAKDDPTPPPSTTDPTNDPGTNPPVDEGPKNALGDSEAMVYSLLYASEVSTLNYLTAGAQWEQTVAANIIDTLVEYDSNGNLQPSLAESWEESENDNGEVTWIFNLRKGVYWYDYQGNPIAELTANDFVSAAQYVMTPAYESSTFNQMTMIKNAEAYFNGEVTDFAEVGVKAIDEYTLEYTLESPVPYFLSCLTYTCYLPAYGPLLDELGAEFGTANDKLYYCGAYILTEYVPQERHTYEKNYENWDASNIHITKIARTYNSESATLGPELALRGEVDYAELSNDMVDDWKLNHPEYVSMDRVIPDYSYFYAFNFNPQYDEAYEPGNWAIAVQNENFRHAFMSAFDRMYSMVALAPDTADQLVQTSINPRGFASVDGTDFADLAPFDGLEQYYFDTVKALEYKQLAMDELSAQGVTFPVKVLLTYRSDYSDWESETVLLEQQVESVLGTDFIDIIPYAGPSENFLSATRRAGVYSIMRVNWGADYQDPETWTDPFAPAFETGEDGNKTDVRSGNSYNKMDLFLDADGAMGDLMREYYALVDTAKAITGNDDTYARYVAFAEAEAFLIKNAIVIPYYVSPAAYIVTRLNIFEGQYASFGVSILRYKGQTLDDNFIDMETYQARFDAWNAGR